MNAPFNHIGVVVANIDEAIARYSQALGLSFAPVLETPVVYRDMKNQSHEECLIRATFSIQGPPYIELVEAAGNGIYALENGERVHHIGIFASEHGAQQNANGVSLPRVMSINMGEHQIGVFTDPADLNGVRVELITEGTPEMLADWLAGKPPA